ncbi:MAG: hypothetical protein ACHREM_18450 [Polyangiales bacterium]
MTTEHVYEVFEIVRGQEVIILRAATLQEAIGNARMHARADHRTAFVRNTITGQVEAVNVTGPTEE